MQIFPPIIVLRHRRENLKKCSLRGLESRNDFKFFSYPIAENTQIPDLSSYIMLSINAPPLTKSDAESGLLILDGTWRYAQKMESYIDSIISLPKRSLPAHYQTAYPRRQEDCSEPGKGLASIEAIYLAFHIFGFDTAGLLDNYHWKEGFLQKNRI